MIESNTIGNRIKELREAKKETQADVAKALMVKRETVNMWENMERDLKTDYTIKLAIHFGTTCDYILRGIKADNISVYEKTGLTDSSIERLASRKDDTNDNFLRTINLLLSDGFFVVEDIARFLYCDYINQHNRDRGQDERYISLNIKNQDNHEHFETSELNAVFLLRAQSSLIQIKDYLLKENSKKDGE